MNVKIIRSFEVLDFSWLTNYEKYEICVHFKKFDESVWIDLLF